MSVTSWLFLSFFFFMTLYGWSLTVSRLQSHHKETNYFLQRSPRNSWYSFDLPHKDERLIWIWSYLAVLNAGPLNGESSALITRPLLHWLYTCSIFKFLNQSYLRDISCSRATISCLPFHGFRQSISEQVNLSN